MTKQLIFALATMGAVTFGGIDDAEARGQPCRDFSRTYENRGNVQISEGTECLNWDGTWSVVSERTSTYPRYAQTRYYSSPAPSYLNINFGNSRPVIIRKDIHDNGHWHGYRDRDRRDDHRDRDRRH